MRELPARRLALTILAVFVAFTAFFSLAVSDRVPDYLRAHESDDPLLPEDPPMRRRDVYELKLRLRDLGFFDGDMDEEYDAEAVLAVKEFQSSFWLAPTGIVDQATWRALGYGVTRDVSVATGPLPEGVVHLEVDTDRLELTVYVDSKPWKTYPVAGGKWSALTPVGEWKIVDKGYEQGGAFGSRWMGLDVPWGGYGIHGTNRPWSIGTYASVGCIRMFNEDVEELYEIVEIGTRVVIRGPRPYLTLEAPLGKGAIGPEVVMLQECLKAAGFDPGACDGRLGTLTESQIEEASWLFGLGDSRVATADLYTLLGMKGR